MIRREDFIDALGMPDEGFTNAVDAALRQVKEGEARPVMKRKMTLTVLAAVLAVIALTGAALAVGLNLFDHFGRNDRRFRTDRTYRRKPGCSGRVSEPEAGRTADR